MSQLPASVIKHVHMADEPFVLPHGEGQPSARAPVAAVAVPRPAVLPAPAPIAPAAETTAPTPAPATATAPRAAIDPVQLRQKAYDEGFEAGLRQGLAQAASEMESAQRELLRQIEETKKAREALEAQAAKANASAQAFDNKSRLLDSARQALNEAKAEQIQSAEDDLVSLSFGIAAKVFEQSAVSPEFLVSLVRRAIGEMGHDASFTVHVHPEDYDWLKSDPAFASDSAPSLKWLADPAVEMGGCILHTEHAALDARLEQQVQALRQRLLQIRSQRKEPAVQEGVAE